LPKQRARERRVDDGREDGSLRIAGREIAPCNARNADRLEEARRDPVHARLNGIAAQSGDERGGRAAAERAVLGESRRFDSWQQGDTTNELRSEEPDAIGVIHFLLWFHREQQDPIGRDVQVDGPQVGKGADEEPGDHQQCQRERDLGDDQRLAKTGTAGHAHVLKCGPRSWRTKVQADLRTEEATEL
jgi:hypothetical protein